MIPAPILWTPPASVNANALGIHTFYVRGCLDAGETCASPGNEASVTHEVTLGSVDASSIDACDTGDASSECAGASGRLISTDQEYVVKWAAVTFATSYKLEERAKREDGSWSDEDWSPLVRGDAEATVETITKALDGRSLSVQDKRLLQ